MIDNVTGKATRVDFRPVRLEVMLRSLRDRRLLGGYLVQQLLEAARRLWPEFMVDEPTREPVVGHPLRRAEDRAPRPERPFMPRWRRRQTGDEIDDDDVGI